MILDYDPRIRFLSTVEDVFQKRGIRENGEVIGDFTPTEVCPKFSEKLLVSGIALPIAMFEEMKAPVR